LVGVAEVGEGVRVGASDNGQPLTGGVLLRHLPGVAFSRRRQLLRLGLVGGESSRELGRVHWHAVGVQLGTLNWDVLDPACPRSGQGEESLPNTWGEQSADDCGQDWR